MKGMEMMLANMLGIKPDEMQAMIEGLGKAATDGVEMLQRIETNQAQILHNQMDIMGRLERIENGDGKGSERSDSGSD